MSTDLEPEPAEQPRTLINQTRRSRYNAEQVEAALTILALYGDNTKIAAQESGVTADTLRRWREQHRDRYLEIRRDVAPLIEATIADESRATAILAGQAERASITHYMDKLEAGEIKDPAIAAKHMATVKGINVDKTLILEQRPTSIIQHKTADDVLRELTALGYVESTAEEDETPPDNPTQGVVGVALEK